MSVKLSIIAVIGGFLAFFIACTGLSFSIETTTDILSSNNLTDDIVEPLKPTLESWSAKFQVAAWTGLIAFITILIPIGSIKLPITLLEIFGGIIVWLLV